MTGFGSAEYRDENTHISVEIKSYNNRYLDIYLNEPSYLSSLEPEIRKYISGVVIRGKVEVRINIVNYSEEIEVFLNEKIIETYVRVLKDMIRIGKLNDEVRLSHLLRMEGIIKRENTRDVDIIWKILKPTLKEALYKFDEARVVEGNATKKDIYLHLDSIENQVKNIRGFVPLIEEKLARNLRERFNDLFPVESNENDQRILAETAILLARFDINEEIQRLEAHISHFKKTCEESESIGKKLDFICQEMNREINTIGSKNILPELDRIVISVKDALEKIREQVRNVE